MNRDTGWLKSSRSSGGSNTCVEIRLTGTAAWVRDSKHPAGPAFQFSPRAWASFLDYASGRTS